MDEKGYLLGQFYNLLIMYCHQSVPILIGLGTAQVYCVNCGTKEAKKKQG